jgi:hypothetical protein
MVQDRKIFLKMYHFVVTLPHRPGLSRNLFRKV